MTDHVTALAGTMAALGRSGGTKLVNGTTTSAGVSGVVQVDLGAGRIVPAKIPGSFGVNVDSGQKIRLAVDGNTYTVESVLTALAVTMVPVGATVIWWTVTLPTGWLWCNGDAFSSATYPMLAAALGGTTLPDMRGRFPVGHSAGHADFGTLGDVGGATDVTLTVDQMPAHAHTESWANIEGSVYAGSVASGGFYSGDDMSAGTAATESTGGGASHENLPPFKTCNWIIRGA